MSNFLQIIEKELAIPREQLLEKATKKFLETELRNICAEIKKISSRYGVNSFDELWERLEKGDITESECFDDLNRLEYLELEREKIVKLLQQLEPCETER